MTNINTYGNEYSIPINSELALVNNPTKSYLLGESDLGHFFIEQCRGSVAHTWRYLGRPLPLFSYNHGDYIKISKAYAMIESFVQYFIKNGLSEPKSVCIDVIAEI